MLRPNMHRTPKTTSWSPRSRHLVRKYFHVKGRSKIEHKTQSIPKLGKLNTLTDAGDAVAAHSAKWCKMGDRDYVCVMLLKFTVFNCPLPVHGDNVTAKKPSSGFRLEAIGAERDLRLASAFKSRILMGGCARCRHRRPVKQSPPPAPLSNIPH